MTRKDEITKAANRLINTDVEDEMACKLSFIAGARWADKTMIDKACEWLLASFDNLHNEYGRHLEFANKSDFIESFKKAMEE